MLNVFCTAASTHTHIPHALQGGLLLLDFNPATDRHEICKFYWYRDKIHLFFFLKMVARVMALLLSRVEEGPVQSRLNKKILKEELTREFSRTENFSTHNSISEKSDEKILSVPTNLT